MILIFWRCKSFMLLIAWFGRFQHLSFIFRRRVGKKSSRSNKTSKLTAKKFLVVKLQNTNSCCVLNYMLIYWLNNLIDLEFFRTNCILAYVSFEQQRAAEKYVKNTIIHLKLQQNHEKKVFHSQHSLTEMQQRAMTVNDQMRAATWVNFKKSSKCESLTHINFSGSFSCVRTFFFRIIKQKSIRHALDVILSGLCLGPVAEINRKS